MTLFLNWRLGLVLIVLVAVFLCFTADRGEETETAQRPGRGSEFDHCRTAQDALSNVMVVQSFTRLSAEARVVQRHRGSGDPEPVPGTELVGAG